MNSFYNHHSIYDLIAARAESSPDAIAIAAPGRSPLTYHRLQAHVEHTVEALHAMGVGRHDRVALVLPNGPELAVAFLSVAAGATSAPLNPAYTAEEFDFYLSDLNARALIIEAVMASPAVKVAQARGVAIIEVSPARADEAGVFELTGHRGLPVKEGGFASSRDTALVLHTSGTTARPKLVPLTHANICISARNSQSALGLVDTDRCLNVMPLFHVHGLVGALLASLSAGAGIVCTPGFDPLRFFDWMKAFRPTWYTAVPTMHQAILAHAPSNRATLEQHTLRFVRSGSASLPPQVLAALEEAFAVPVIEYYGMTEAASQICSNPMPPGKRKPGSVGLPAGPEVAIMDGQGNLLPAGSRGEIVIRGANVTPGFENNPTANEEVFNNGWFRTGDEGRVDEDGYFFITGRIKEIINRGGEKVSPREVDEVLLTHPDVAQAVTFAVPHSRLGEDVAAAVVLRTPAAATEQEIRQYAFSRLAEYKVPSQVVFVDQIPKGPTGKLQRIGLYEKLAPLFRTEFVPPGTGVEKALADLWLEVLAIHRVSIHDNFFMLGGDSLAGTRVMLRVCEAFAMDLPPTTIFETPTIAGLATLIEERLLAEIAEEGQE
jgi:acyl-CoA synthetase (AMP-forming)/AMP-acid ligase II/acyl carrier protein